MLPTLIGPVAKNIAELEGEKLGGYLSELILQWLSGIPLVTIRSKLTTLNGQSLEDLISVIYSRIQFLLPWGLFATDSIVQEEAKKRRIQYNNEIKSISYLADAGVPNFDALRLVNVGFERVDATRLSKYYKSIGGMNIGTDVFGWLLNEQREVLNRVIRGTDNRSIDFDFTSLIDSIRNRSGG